MAETDVELVYSSLLELELIEAAYKVALKERYGTQWRNARPDGRARRRATRIAEGALEAWSDVTDVLPPRRIEASEVTGQVRELMRKYSLRSYDAVPVATAFAAGARDLYALDSGFARVPAAQLTIYTVTAKVPRMRAIRAGTN